MIKVANCPCSLDDALRIPYGEPSDDAILRRIAAKALGVKPREVASVEVLRRSVDARKKSNVHYVLTLAVALKSEKAERMHVGRGKAQPYCAYEPLRISPVAGGELAHAAVNAPVDGGQSTQVPPTAPGPFGRDGNESAPHGAGEAPGRHTAPSAACERPIVVGLGPAGLFAALYLARAGLRPLVVERGADVRKRQRAVAAFNQGGSLDERTNIQFGEGGAGTFSDGKLTTGTKHPYAADVLHWFVDAGAPRQILWDAKPHIGSDVLPDVVESLRNRVAEAGGEVRFETRLADVRLREGRLASVQLESPDGALYEEPADVLVLACGHSARDTFGMLKARGLLMERKPFSMGVRIEHRQAAIDVAQYGPAAGHPALGPAEYKMAVHVDERRSAYTFCMCPGGEVVCAASEEGGICTNGMSNLARDGENANAALLVNVDPSDLPGDDPLAGVLLQREVEQRAFRVAREAGGAPYQAPCQTVGSFLGSNALADDMPPKPTAYPTCARGTVACDLHDVLPGFVCDTLAQALPLFNRKLRGFAAPDALLTAPETRSSSPVRIVRTEGFQAVVGHDGENCGIYPCGEGPGYAGGIMSAACDGMRVAAHVVEDLRERMRAHVASSLGRGACEPPDVAPAVAAEPPEAAPTAAAPTAAVEAPDVAPAETVEAPDVAPAVAVESPEAAPAETVEPPEAAPTAAAPTAAAPSAVVESPDAAFGAAVDALRAGEAVVFPTDTVAGLGVSALHAGAPDEIFRIKRRKPDKPVAWLVDGPRALREYGRDLPEGVEALAQAHWPGPLTIIVKASAAVPRAFRSQAGTIGLRMPDNATALRLIAATGSPLATSSANISGDSAPDVPARVTAEVREAAGAVLEDASHPSGLASTVLDCSCAPLRILRGGAITEAAIAAFLPSLRAQR